MTSNVPSHIRAISSPEDSLQKLAEERQKESAFPRLFDYCGYLDIRTRSTKSWKRKYFVLANNFLLMSSTPYSSKLEKVIPLEGSNIKTTTKTSNLSFEILVRKKRNQFRAPNETECNSWTEKIQRASKLKIKDIYRFDQVLGSNATGSTKVLSAKHRVTGEEVAVKVISKKEYNPKMLSNEVLILKRLDHPHVVKLFDLFETKRSVYLVMEKCLGGELFEQIAALDGSGFNEKECIGVLHQIAKAVKYMHSMGIVHRDLKPENILCVKPNSIQQIKIADFGISKVIFDPEVRRKEKIERRKQQKAMNKNKNKQKQLRTLRQRTKELHEQQYYHSNPHEEEKEDSFSNSPSHSHSSSPSNPHRKNSHHPQNSPRKKRRKSKHGKNKKKFIDPLAKKKHGANSRKHSHRMSNNYFNAKRYDQMTTMCGTISYTAPEILKEKPYDKRVDYWSLGVIAFILLCGYPPFWGDTELDVARNILSERIRLDENDWVHVSDNGRKLVLGLLEKNPSRRLGVDDILKHTWILASKSTSNKARKSLMKTVAKRRIRKMSMGVFETKSKNMSYLYRNYMKNKNKNNDNNNANDEDGNSSVSSLSSVSSPSSMTKQSSASSNTSMEYNYGHSRNSMSLSSNDGFRRYSKTDEDLFELRLPSQISWTPRASINVLDVDDDIDDQQFFSDISHSKSNSNSVKRKWSQ